ncbi:glycosyltransferase family 2 protein [Methylobacter luteus]|uniref:glycosyltransferase family 2 protein n=1 Tax=Methylobacter luteus TaxID=415 RepID=UPI00040DD150|nr:glycosyltransferase family 2 protein [Methylobacter luteus]
MKKNLPTVSVIMPMRNAEAYVYQAIESVLNQSFCDLELVVIDDHSTDQSRKIVEDFLARDSRLRLLNSDERGVAAARNNGLKSCQGEFILFCDADDQVPENRIADQINWLNHHTTHGAVCASFAMMDDKGRNVLNLNNGDNPCDITEELLSGKTRTSLCTFAIRREFINKINGFRDYFVTSSDIDLQLRLAEVCNIFYVPEVVYFYRLNDSSIVHTQPSKKRIFFEETARLFRQQRAEQGIDDLQSGHPPLVPEDQGDAFNSKDQLQGALIGTAWRLHKQGEKLKAIKSGFRACLINPANLMAWKSYIMLFIK